MYTNSLSVEVMAGYYLNTVDLRLIHSMIKVNKRFYLNMQNSSALAAVMKFDLANSINNLHIYCGFFNE